MDKELGIMAYFIWENHVGRRIYYDNNTIYFDSTLDGGKLAFLLLIPEIRDGKGGSETELPSGGLETILRIPKEVERPQ